MIGFSRGDVVLVAFVFADESGAKRRPAVIVSTSEYQNARQEVVVAAITSNVRRRLFGDQPIADWQGAGLLFPSTLTAILRTIKHSMITRKLGSMASADLRSFSDRLRRALGL